MCSSPARSNGQRKIDSTKPGPGRRGGGTEAEKQRAEKRKGKIPGCRERERLSLRAGEREGEADQGVSQQ